MATQASTTRSKIWDAIQDIGWFPAFYSWIIGGLAVIDILQTALDFRLTRLVQWIVDGYQKLTTLLAAIIEPLIMPVIHWINTILGWHLVLDPIWRPTFLLCSLMVVALARAMWQARGVPLLKRFILTSATSLGGAALFMTISLLGGLFLGWVVPALGHWASPDLVHSVSVLGTAAVVLFWGVYLLFESHPVFVRSGLYMIGGFVTATVIVAADQVVKWFGFLGL